MKTWVTVAGVLVVTAGIVYVASLNTGPTEIELRVARLTDVPLWQALLGCLFLGAAGTAAVLSWPIFRLKFEGRRSRRRIAQLEQEIHGLRTLPLSDAAPGSDTASGN